MDEKLAYVTRRTNANGKARWYWQRPGHKLRRLPDDPVERFREAKRLNDAATRDEALVPEARGSIAWVVAKYKEGKEYGLLAPATKRYYDPLLDDILELGRHRPFAELNRTAVVDYVESWPQWHQQRKAAAVLRNLFNIATYYGVVAANEAYDLRIESGKPRQVVWSEREIASWLDAAEAHRQAGPMALAFQLLRYTAQRPTDCLRMRRHQYDGRRVELVQQKTGALVWVPCHTALRAVLDALPGRGSPLHLVGQRPEPVPYSSFIVWFTEITRAAGLQERDLQPRDLRRTAVVRLAEAGCTVPEVAAITGHTIDQTQKILETYLPRTFEMAQNAINKWERKGRKGGTRV